MRLSSRNNRLNYRSEGVPPKILRWLRRKLSFIIYYIILAVVLFSVGRTVWYRFGYINGNGILYFDSWRVRADRDLYILDKSVSEGDFIDYKDTLIWWVEVENDDDNNGRRGGGEYSLGIATLERKKVSLTQSHNEKSADLQEAYRNRSLLKKELQRNQNLLSLELKPERNVAKIRSDLALLNNRIAKLETMLSMLKKSKQNIDNIKPLIPAVTASPTSETDTIGGYIAPVFGEVSEIFALPGEYVEEGEEILRLTSTQNMRILSYFDLKYLQDVRKGRSVYIYLPDRTIFSGVIRNVFTATRHLPEEFKQAYDIARPRIIAEILPADTLNLPPLSGLTVNVRIKR